MIHFALMLNKGEFVSRLLDKVSLVESNFYSIELSAAAEDFSWALTITEHELEKWIRCCAIFGAHDALKAIVTKFSGRIKSIFLKDQGVDTVPIFKWTFIHGEEMIKILEEFISNVGKIEIDFSNSFLYAQ